jgi:hypothetical protein
VAKSEWALRDTTVSGCDSPFLESLSSHAPLLPSWGAARWFADAIKTLRKEAARPGNDVPCSSSFHQPTRLVFARHDQGVEGRTAKEKKKGNRKGEEEKKRKQLHTNSYED